MLTLKYIEFLLLIFCQLSFIKCTETLNLSPESLVITDVKDIWETMTEDEKFFCLPIKSRRINRINVSDTSVSLSNLSKYDELLPRNFNTLFDDDLLGNNSNPNDIDDYDMVSMTSNAFFGGKCYVKKKSKENDQRETNVVEDLNLENYTLLKLKEDYEKPKNLLSKKHKSSNLKRKNSNDIAPEIKHKKRCVYNSSNNFSYTNDEKIELIKLNLKKFNEHYNTINSFNRNYIINRYLNAIKNRFFFISIKKRKEELKSKKKYNERLIKNFNTFIDIECYDGVFCNIIKNENSRHPTSEIDFSVNIAIETSYTSIWRRDYILCRDILTHDANFLFIEITAWFEKNVDLNLPFDKIKQKEAVHLIQILKVCLNYVYEFIESEKISNSDVRIFKLLILNSENSDKYHQICYNVRFAFNELVKAVSSEDIALIILNDFIILEYLKSLDFKYKVKNSISPKFRMLYKAIFVLKFYICDFYDEEVKKLMCSNFSKLPIVKVHVIFWKLIYNEIYGNI